MTEIHLYSATAFILFFLGLYYVAFAPLVITRILAINVMGVGIFMLLVAQANSYQGHTDPVPHAMILTGIVVAVAGTVLALLLVKRIKALIKQTHLVDHKGDTHE